MKLLSALSSADLAALALFALCWVGYEPLLKRLAGRGAHSINSHMAVLRMRWMRNMAGRENRFLDSQLLGHALNSASFFVSANLIVMAAAAGTLFGGATALRGVASAPLIVQGPQILLEAKFALVVAVLGRSLLSFIWAIRQMNYCLAAVGAAPEPTADPAMLKAYGDAAASVLNPALSSFSAGVRGYYFALAAGSWLLGPIAFALVTAGAVALLVWRQWGSGSADGIRRLREILERPSAQP